MIDSGHRVLIFLPGEEASVMRNAGATGYVRREEHPVTLIATPLASGGFPSLPG